MFYSGNGTRTVSSPYRDQLLKKQLWDVYISDLITGNLIFTGHFGNHASIIYCSFSKDLASTCYKQPTSLSMFLLKGAFPQDQCQGSFDFYSLTHISEGKVVTWNLFLCIVYAYLWLNYEMPQEYFVRWVLSNFF